MSIYIELQVRNVSAAYIMKCDDDTFIRVDTILQEIEGVSPRNSVYMGNLNLQHRPLRAGKWAVTYEVVFFFRKSQTIEVGVFFLPSCAHVGIHVLLISVCMVALLNY